MGHVSWRGFVRIAAVLALFFVVGCVANSAISSRPKDTWTYSGMFFGDSRTVNAFYGLTETSTDAKTAFDPVTTSHWVAESMQGHVWAHDKLDKINAEIVIYNLGINDLNGCAATLDDSQQSGSGCHECKGDPLTAAAHNFAVVEEICAKPTTKMVYIVEVYPVYWANDGIETADSVNLNADITTYNDLMKSRAEATDGVRYISWADVDPDYTGKNIRRSLAVAGSDGIHLGSETKTDGSYDFIYPARMFAALRDYIGAQ